MTLEVGDKVHHVNLAPGTQDTVVDAVGPCTLVNHQNENGDACEGVMVTVTDPTTGNPFSAHEDNFVKIED